MILGIGVDLVEIARLEQGLARFGEHYADRILSAHEHSDFFASSDPARFLAKRFAAKEALAKAAGTGLRHPLGLRRIAVQHSPLGQPHFRFDDAVDTWLKARGIVTHHLSLSDERAHAVAFVVLETA
jgi:holo-[acyl-carrier protein] synthase